MNNMVKGIIEKSTEIKAPDSQEAKGKKTIFVAGAIDMGEAEDWQSQLANELKDYDVALYNPRRDDWDSSWEQEIENPEFREQVEWELKGQERADIIALNFTEDSKAPISLLELGLFARTGKLIVCCPEGFYRKGNVDIVCKRYNVKEVDNWDDFVQEIKSSLGGGKMKDNIKKEWDYSGEYVRAAQKAIDETGLKGFDLKEVASGIKVEYEHGTGKKSDAGAPDTNVTDDDLVKTAKIAIAHLRELPDYYTRLDEMEEKGKEAIKKGRPVGAPWMDDTTLNAVYKYKDMVVDKSIAPETAFESILQEYPSLHPKEKGEDFEWFWMDVARDGLKIPNIPVPGREDQWTIDKWMDMFKEGLDKFWETKETINKDSAEKILKDLIKNLHKQMGQEEKDEEEEEEPTKGTAKNDKISYHSSKDSKAKSDMSAESTNKARLEIQEMIDNLTSETEEGKEGIKKTPSNIKSRLLSGIEHFLEKYEEGDDTSLPGNLSDTGIGYNPISKSFNARKMSSAGANPIVKDVFKAFLKGYERLAYLGNDLSNEKLNSLFLLATDINKSKQFNLPLDESNRLEKVISIDSVAHKLHNEKNEDGSSQYQILDELADISKSFGERERNTRLIIINDPTKVDNIEKLLDLEILQKGMLEKSGRFWKMFEKAIREGVDKLSDYEVIALREWVYAKI